MKRTGFDKRRIDLMVAILNMDTPLFRENLGQVLENLRGADRLDEASQKAVNQIRLMIRRFQRGDRLSLDVPCAAMVAQVKHVLARIIRHEVTHPIRVNFDGWRKDMGIGEEALPLIMDQVTVFQLTKGCSNSCRRCNEWALPAPRGHFSFGAVKTIVSMMAAMGNQEAIYYGASDPLDWTDGPHTIIDVMEVVAEKGIHPFYGLLTKVPRKKTALLALLIMAGTDVGVSVTTRNRRRVKQVATETGMPLSVYHDHDELLIPAGLDEDFTSVKPSITDNYGVEITPEGLFLIVPTFTSALNPTGQYRIPVCREIPFVLMKKTGRAAMQVEYYKPLEAVDMTTGRPFRLSHLLPPQIENILLDHGRYDLTPPGMTSFPEYLTTFDGGAVAKRRELAPAAIKGFKEIYCSQGSLKNASEAEKNAFKMHAKHYMACCNQESLSEMKRYMMSYYLAAVADYLRDHPSEREIIRFLRDEGKRRRKKTVDTMIARYRGDMDGVMDDADAFDTPLIFQGMLDRLVMDPDDAVIHGLIQRYPAQYHGTLDRFVRL